MVLLIGEQKSKGLFWTPIKTSLLSSVAIAGKTREFRKMKRNGITTLFVVLLFPLVFASSDVCPDVKTCITTLGQAFTSLCNETIPALPCSCPVEWESSDLIQLGTINMGSTSTQSFVIPSSSVPSTAREVLVYVYAYMGTSQDVFAQMKIYTESSPTRKFVKYLALKAYNQNAYAVASDNMFFPMPSNRRVYVMLSRTLSGYVFGYVNIIGYR